MDPALVGIVEKAWSEGQTVDLSRAAYGPGHFGDPSQFFADPFPYYYFLAGLVRSQGCRRILEIGSHFGGSAYSLLCGVSDKSRAQVVTVDITDLNPGLYRESGITKIVGDANSERVAQTLVTVFEGGPIDLLYVDAAHEFMPTLINIGLYRYLFRPRLIVVDDIVLNSEMRRLWSVIRATQRTDAINCADVIPEIRAQNVGFGLLRG